MIHPKATLKVISKDAFKEAALNRKKSEMLKEKAPVNKSTRDSLPQARILGARHPVPFAMDVDEFMLEYKYAGGSISFTQAKMIEQAFYQFREKINGKAIPDWLKQDQVKP
jgi:hypothetical protein